MVKDESNLSRVFGEAKISDSWVPLNHTNFLDSLLISSIDASRFLLYNNRNVEKHSP